VAAESTAVRRTSELGVKRINTVSMDPDLARTFDQFAALAEMAAAVGVEVTTELSPGLTVADLRLLAQL